MLKFTWLGGPTFLLELGQFRWLSDPMFGEGLAVFIMHDHPEPRKLKKQLEVG